MANKDGEDEASKQWKRESIMGKGEDDEVCYEAKFLLCTFPISHSLPLSTHHEHG